MTEAQFVSVSCVKSVVSNRETCVVYTLAERVEGDRNLLIVL